MKSEFNEQLQRAVCKPVTGINGAAVIIHESRAHSGWHVAVSVRMIQIQNYSDCLFTVLCQVKLG
jgi:hypothetical protein